MIVRDEAAHLPACLESVRGLADEIVIVDTGSTDNTLALARAAGARVIEAAWPGDFSVARNLAIAEARGDWILVLDADETLPPASVTRIRELISPSASQSSSPASASSAVRTSEKTSERFLVNSSPVKCAYNLVQKNRLADGSHVSVHIVRLFPRHPDVRFERAIHEQVNTSLERVGIPIVDTDIVFEHSGYASGEVLAGKTERNRQLIEAALARDPNGDSNLRYFYASTFFDTKQFAQAAREYELCAQHSHANRKRLERSATLKAAQSWFLAGEPDKARALLPTELTPDLHPLAAHLRAELAILANQPAEAAKWQESLLAAPDTAYLPPEPLAPLKFKAILFLANQWASRGRKDIGVKLLRLAQEIGAGKRDGASADLAAVYRTLAR